MKVSKDNNKVSKTKNQKSDAQKQAQRISWIVAVVVIIISLFIAILCTVAFNNQPSVPIEYDYVIDNWKKEPILRLEASRVGCKEYFTGFEFPGTVEGCNCKNSQSALYKDQIFDESCTSEQTQNGCQDVQSTVSKTFNQWKLQNEILQLCVFRSTGFNYMKSDCSQSGYQRCGVTSDDKTNPKMFCMSSKEDCPINSIYYGPTAPDNTYYQVIEVGSNRLYTSSKSLTNQPISYSRIARGNVECKDYDNYHYIGNNMKEYELMRGKDNTCTVEETDSRFKQLFQINEEDYMQANNYKEEIQKLPGYPLAQKMQYYLLTRQYIPWNQLDECRFTHMPYFIDLKSKTDLVNNLWVGCIIVNWFVAVLFGLVSNSLRLKLSWKIKNWYIFPAVLLLVIQLAITVITFSYTTEANKNIKALSDGKCSDDETNSFITKYSDDYTNSILNFQIVLLVFVIILMIFTLIFMKTIFIITKLSDKGETIVPQQDVESKNQDSNDNKNDFQAQNQLVEIDQPIDEYNKGYNQNAKGYSPQNNIYPNNNEGTTQDIYSNFNNNGNTKTTQQDTVNVPFVINASQDPESTKKGVLKKGGANQLNKSGNGINNSNQKSTKFDDEHYNNQFEKNKELENLYASNYKNNTAGTQNNNQNLNNSSMNNLNVNNSILKNSQNKNSNTGRTMESIHEEDPNGIGRVKFQTEKNNKSRNDLQLNVVQNNAPKSHSNLNSAQKQVNYSQVSQQEQAIKSLAQLDDLVDNNDWEFEIDDYVKKHRENQQSSNRIGGGYEIGKPREKYLPHKFIRQSAKKIQTENSIENGAENISPEKFQMLDKKGTINILSPERTQNEIESNHDLEKQMQDKNVQNQNVEQAQQQNMQHQDIEVTKLQ